MSKQQPLLKFGDRGSDVVELQQFLSTVRIDGRPLHDGHGLGRFDETTREGVTRLQAALIKGELLELKQPNGQFGPMTKDAWDKADAATRSKLGSEVLSAPQQAVSEEPSAITVTAVAEKETPNKTRKSTEIVQPLPKAPPHLFANEIGVNIPYVTYDKGTLESHEKHAVAIRMAQNLHAQGELPGMTFRTPYASAPAVMTSARGDRGDPIKGGVQNHKGIDLVGKGNKELAAPFDGVAVLGTGRSGDGKGYGEHLTIYGYDQKGELLQVKLAHMVRGSIPEALRGAPTVVTAGQAVGVEGSTGRSTGPHLHFEVRTSTASLTDTKDDFGRVINPAPLLGMHGGTLLAYGASPNAPVQVASAGTQSAAALMREIIREKGLGNRVEAATASMVTPAASFSAPPVATTLPYGPVDEITPQSASFNTTPAVSGRGAKPATR